MSEKERARYAAEGGKLMPAPPSREAAIAARLEKYHKNPPLSASAQEFAADLRYLLAQLQQARQERDEWKRRAEAAEGRIANATA